NVASFANAAAYCDELIATTDTNGNAIHIARYRCNLILTKRKSAADVIRSVRVACGLMLRYGANGLLELLPETSLALQHPSLPDGSNVVESLNGGWPVYEFSDSSAAASGIARNPDGTSTVRLVSKSISESSNRVTVEFQDEANEYQQDTLSVVSDDDQALIGYEVGSTSTALGLPNFNQALRILSRQIGKATKGNRFIEFGTSFRALKVRPGDIIALTYLKEGLSRTPFRVVKLAPSINYRNVSILAQAHDDSWYSDDPGNGSGGGRQPGAGIALPRPLLGPTFDANGGTQFSITESITGRTDGGAATILTVGFVNPVQPLTGAPIVPLLNLSPQVSTSAGSLKGGTNYYYALTANDDAGNEGSLSFTIRAAIPQGNDTNSVDLTGLSLPSTAASFNVYRGTSPQLLYRIASNQPIATAFTDSGLPAQPLGPPDASFDHANFYYRMEIAGPIVANVFSSTTIGSSDMNATRSAYAGMIVRIVAGSGAGQERRITANDESTLTISPGWSIAPD
ncbi:MAG TPA: phage tail protein, partial [Bryobacteraceae bacterium]|nr:phage tail protein [Bryobacteraceae bacterium]